MHVIILNFEINIPDANANISVTQAPDAEVGGLKDHTGRLPTQRDGLLQQGDTDTAHCPFV